MSNKRANLTVEGMSCQHCVKSINKALNDMAGVADVTVDLKEKRVTVEYDPGLVALQAIIDEIEEQGYNVVDSTD